MAQHEFVPGTGQENSVQSLNGHFKELYADKIRDLIPDGVKLYNMVPFQEAKKLGASYNQPVTLGLEHGFTYGGQDGSAFELMRAIASTHANASIKGHEMVLRSYLSVGAVSRSMSSQAAFVQESKLIVQNMLKSFARRLEVQLMYGKVGLGRIASGSAVYDALSNTTSVVIEDSEWAAGIWAGAEKMEVDICEDTEVATTSVAPISASISSVSFESKTLVLNGDHVASIGALTKPTLVYAGAKGKEFAGIHKIMSNVGDEIFGIDASKYSLFRSNQVDVGSTVLSFEKLEEAVAIAMEKGLVDEDVLVICNPRSWKNLLTEQASQRMFDSSYSSDKMTMGSKNIEFYGQNGKIEITSSIFCKEGYAYVLPVKEFSRIGSSDITFDQPGFEGKFLKLLEHANAYELRAYTDQALFCPAPGLCTLMKNIIS